MDCHRPCCLDGNAVDCAGNILGCIHLADNIASGAALQQRLRDLGLPCGPNPGEELLAALEGAFDTGHAAHVDMLKQQAVQRQNDNRAAGGKLSSMWDCVTQTKDGKQIPFIAGQYPTHTLLQLSVATYCHHLESSTRAC